MRVRSAVVFIAGASLTLGGCVISPKTSVEVLDNWRVDVESLTSEMGKRQFDREHGIASAMRSAEGGCTLAVTVPRDVAIFTIGGEQELLLLTDCPKPGVPLGPSLIFISSIGDAKISPNCIGVVATPELVVSKNKVDFEFSGLAKFVYASSRLRACRDSVVTVAFRYTR